MTIRFNPKRLKLARVRKLYTLKALAEKIGLSSRMVAEYEKKYCSYIPKEETIAAYEMALGYPRKFLLCEDELETVEPDSVSFRSLKSMKAANQHAAIAAGSLGLMLDEYLSSKFNLPEISVPDLREFEPEAAAEALRELWDLGSKSISNLVHLLEKHGIRVFSLSENTQSVDAFSFWKGEKAFVYLNTQKSGERSRMDAAHELGHLVLHRHGVPQGADVEMEADKFAYFFLMPRKSVLSIETRNISVNDVIHIKSQWKTSAMSVIMQLRAVNLLTEWHHRSLIIEASKRGLRTCEINGIERESSKLLSMLFEQLDSDGISMKNVAEYLAVPLEEITNLIFKVGLVNTAPDKIKTSEPRRPNLTLVT
jgi:Zn-dependent peptidase ImmA (M78 family)